MAFNLKKNIGTLGGLLLSLLITSGTIMLGMILYFYVYLPAITNHGETITVPSIEGMSIEQLESFLVQRNLRYEVNDSSYSDKHPALTVLKQYPSAGAKVKENRVIYISLNRLTPPTVPLPNLIDGSLTNADAVLKSNELRRGRIELVRGPYLQVVKEMKYKGQPITAGTRIPKSSVIDLVVMDGGSNIVSLPDLIGYTLEDAKFVISGSNLNLEIFVVGDTIGEEPVVLKQKPTYPQNIRVGDIVEIWVGKKGTPLPEEEEIPEEQNP